MTVGLPQPQCIAPLRLMFVTDQFLPRVGGVEILALREARALRSLAIDAHILTPRLDRRWPRREELEGVPVRRLGGLFIGRKLRLRFGGQWMAETRLCLELVRRHHEYDVVHLRQLTYLARPVALIALLTRKPVVVQIASAGSGRQATATPGAAVTLYVGGLDPNAPFLRVSASSWGGSDIQRLRRRQWAAGLTLWLLRKSGAAFLAVSRRTRAHLIEDGVRSEQIVLLPTGIETACYDAAARRVEARLAARAQARTAGAELATDDLAHPTVLYTGRCNYVKGPDILLHAWRHVVRRVPGARLVMAGGGQLREQLGALASALGISESVSMVGVRSDIPDLLASVDAFVLPSRHEGLANALLEAMAAGLPCVATRVSGSEDVIVDGECGLLVPPEDPVALAEALLHVLERPADALALGQAARLRVQTRYARETQMRELIGLYQHLRAGGTVETWRPEVEVLPLAGMIQPVVTETAVGGGTME